LNRPAEKSLTGSLLEIVGPLLIMLMVGSVVWFLIEVFYRGPHNARLCWVFGLFTAAAVLVSRISIESSRERSFVFAVPLAGAATFVSLALIEGGPLFPVLLIAFVLLVLWLSDRLTWDATVIDESRDVSAVGLVELAKRRLHISSADKAKPAPSKPGETATVDLPTRTEDDPIDETATDAQAGNLIRALTKGGRRRNVPGIWSLYFSIGALVVFGLGQLFVRPDFEWGYLWVSTLFAVFIAASLSLMTLTSLLGLQRYLLKRKLEMPDDLPRRWLTAGITIAIAAAILTLLVPRPNLPGRLENAVAWLTSRPRDPSSVSFGRDGTQQGPNARSATTHAQAGGQPQSGNSGQQPVRNNSQNDQSSQSNSGGNSQTGSGAPPGGDSGNGKQSPGNQSGGNQPGGKSGSSQSGQQQSGDKSDSAGQQNQSGEKQNSGGEKGEKSDGGKKPAGEKSGDQQSGENKQSGGDDPANKSDPNNESAENKNDGQKQGDGQKQSGQSQGNSGNAQQNAGQPPKSNTGNTTGNQAGQSSPPPPQTPSGGSPSFSNAAGKMAKMLVMFAGLIALLVVGWLFRDEIAKLLVELRNWLDGLTGKKEPVDRTTADIARMTQVERKLAFADCSNPFRDGSWRKSNPRQLAQQTLVAMEALAAELKVTRAAELTPAEFAAEVASRLQGLAVPAQSLADVYGWVAYSGVDVSPDQLKQLQLIWKQMEQFSSGARTASV